MGAGNNALIRIVSRTSPMAVEGSKEHVILGIDASDIKAQKDRWLAENPQIKVSEIGDIKPEPPSLLVRFGGRCVPRFSLLLRYSEEDEHPLSDTDFNLVCGDAKQAQEQ
ncbi:hypothetical protein [Bradyrhizobium sp.]|uniref:hypothetical protein n=1 Tax=Bradyrhizobium sp. TaxID=376 RepID=UPI003BB1905C